MSEVDRFSLERFREVWSGLSSSTQAKIRAKASADHITLSAVIRDWWPAIWERVKEKP